MQAFRIFYEGSHGLRKQRGLRVIALASIDDVSENPCLKSAKTTADIRQT
jgi:hypothetical protein